MELSTVIVDIKTWLKNLSKLKKKKKKKENQTEQIFRIN